MIGIKEETGRGRKRGSFFCVWKIAAPNLVWACFQLVTLSSDPVASSTASSPTTNAVFESFTNLEVKNQSASTVSMNDMALFMRCFLYQPSVIFFTINIYIKLLGRLKGRNYTNETNIKETVIRPPLEER